jgi:hypothetical protein
MTSKVCGMHIAPALSTSVNVPADDTAALVQAWRARGAAARDPVAFAVIEGLARRAQAQHGQARQLLLCRVHELLARLAAAPGALLQGGEKAPADAQASASQTALAGLSELIDRLGRSATPTLPSVVPGRPGVAGQGERPRAALRATAVAATPRPLKAVAAFKGTWSRLRAEQRLRQALAQVPAKAGPLNSSHVVHRALQTLHTLSPAYLDAFMSHIDTLLWLEQASGGADPAARVSPRADGNGTRRPSRSGAPSGRTSAAHPKP